MNPKESMARIARIRRCALRVRLSRAWQNPRSPSWLIARLLQEIESALPESGELREAG